MDNSNKFQNLGLQDLTTSELIAITGGNWFVDAVSSVAYAVGYVVGFVAHAVVDATLIITGNYNEH